MSKVNYLDLDFINEVADKLRTESGVDGSSFVDVEAIANKLGFEVYETTFDDSNISGKVINHNSQKEIYITSDSFERQRFTIAHEIGHIILHHGPNDEICEIDYRHSESKYTRKEYQANAFASALLMPKDKVKSIWKKLNDVDDLADYFKVSKKAASIRLINLELI